MPLNKDSLARIITIDRCLRNTARLWDKEALMKQCEESLRNLYAEDPSKNFSVSERTFYRDISFMRDSEGFNAPIAMKARKYYYYTDKDYTMLSVSGTPQNMHDLVCAAAELDIKCRFGKEGENLEFAEELLSHIVCWHPHHYYNNLSIERAITAGQQAGPFTVCDFFRIIRKSVPVILTVKKPSKRVKDMECHVELKKEQKIHLSPYVLRKTANYWYLFGYDPEKQKMRAINITEIYNIEEDNEYPRVYTTLNLMDYFKDMVGAIRSDMDIPQDIVIRVMPEYVDELVLTNQIWPDQKWTREYKDYSVDIEFKAIINEEFVEMIMGYGDKIEVMQPKSLRDSVIRKLEATLNRYKNTDKKHLVLWYKSPQLVEAEYIEKYGGDQRYLYKGMTKEEIEDLMKYIRRSDVVEHGYSPDAWQNPLLKKLGAYDRYPYTPS